MTHQLSSYIGYYLSAISGLKSSNAFISDFAKNVLDTSKTYHDFTVLEYLRKRMYKDHSTINYVDLGAGKKDGKRKVSSIAKSSLSSKNQCRVLFNLINYQQPNYSLELGTSLGLSTLYMAKAKKDNVLYTIEGNPDSAHYANQLFNQYKANNIKSYIGNFDEQLSEVLSQLKRLDFVFIDGNHRGDATIRYFSQVLPLCHENSIILFDDIYWSKDMTEAWETIKNHEMVKTSIDIFDIGIVFLDSKLDAQSYRLIEKWKKPWS